MATVDQITGDVLSQPPIARVPELCNGDRLTRAEFERRYTAMPHLKKAELIEGVVYIMPSPVSHKNHSLPHSMLMAWLGHYWVSTPGVEPGDNATVRLDLENEPQPDAFLRILPSHGGQSWDEETYVGGAPELTIEVAASSESYDMHDKLRAYQRNGVLEYLIWRVRDKAVDWFALREGRFELLSRNSAGHYKSGAFPGLWLDPAALLRGDLPGAIAVLKEGIASEAHAAFVTKLQAAVKS